MCKAANNSMNATRGSNGSKLWTCNIDASRYTKLITCSPWPHSSTTLTIVVMSTVSLITTPANSCPSRRGWYLCWGAFGATASHQHRPYLSSTRKSRDVASWGQSTSARCVYCARYPASREAIARTFSGCPTMQNRPLWIFRSQLLCLFIRKPLKFWVWIGFWGVSYHALPPFSSPSVLGHGCKM